MPKKKPTTNKRLDKLFDNIAEETPNSKKLSRIKKRDIDVSPPPPNVDITSKVQQPIRTFEPIKANIQTSDQSLSLGFQVGPDEWATLKVLDETAKRIWSEEDRLLVKQVTDQLSLALENARLFQETQRRAQEMSALAEVGREISATLDLKIVLEKIAEYAIILLNAVTSAVYIPDPELNHLIPLAVMGDEAEAIRNDVLHIGEGILGHIAVYGTGEIVNEPEKDPRAITIQGTSTEDVNEHLMAVPVMLQNRLTGLMAIWRVGKGTEFNEAEFEFFSNLAQQAAIAIENARLFQSVTQSQTQLSEALHIARIGYFEIDWENQSISLTDELFAMLNTNIEKEEKYTFPLQEVFEKFIFSEDREKAAMAVNDAIFGSGDNSAGTTSELRYITSDGSIIWVNSTYRVEYDSQNRPIKLVGSSQDITDRKTNELIQSASKQISDAALTSRNVHDLFAVVHKAIELLLPSKNFYAALYDSETNIIRFPFYTDEHDTEWESRKLGRGLTSYIIRTRKPLRTTPEIFAELEATGEVLSDGVPNVDFIGIPMQTEETIFGVIAVQTYDTSVRLSEKQMESFSVIGSQTVAALERLRAGEALRRRNTYLAASAEIGQLVTSTLDINTIFSRTVNLINERLGFYFASIYQIDDDLLQAVFREGNGKTGEIMKSQKYQIRIGANTVVGKAAESLESIVINDVTTNTLFQSNPMLPETKSEVAIPLQVGGNILGVIDIQSNDLNAFANDDLAVLKSLSDQVAVAINNATLYSESQELIKNLKEIDQLKSQFLANMSHELRTPLNSIIGFSRVILKGIDGPITEMQNQDLTAIYNSGQHLLGLINDILDLARIEAGKMELNFEEVKLTDIVTSVLSTAKGLVKEKPIQLIERIPLDFPTIRGDTMRVRQVLLNLISNASKFTDEGTITIEAKIQPGSTGAKVALISVTDTGSGISNEGQERLFKAFSQVDGSATRKSGGSGLGLSICANLVQLHGGQIGVLSEEGQGSTFWFTIPLFSQPLENIPDGKKIIVSIDDDLNVTSLYNRYLTPKGYHVVPISDPSRALERIKNLKPYAVTLDIMMPGTDGWSVLSEIKSDPTLRDIPVIICSIIEQTEKGFSLGATDYLVKPILEEDLVHAMEKLNTDGNIRKVLVIDDDPNDLRLIEKILSSEGKYQAHLAIGGKEGWNSILTQSPDAIILDIFMPDMDGFMILEKLREDPELGAIPVLVISGGGLTNEQHQLLEEYGQRLITKASLKEEDLIANIESVLNRVGK